MPLLLRKNQEEMRTGGIFLKIDVTIILKKPKELLCTYNLKHYQYHTIVHLYSNKPTFRPYYKTGRHHIFCDLWFVNLLSITKKIVIAHVCSPCYFVPSQKIVICDLCDEILWFVIKIVRSSFYGLLQYLVWYQFCKMWIMVLRVVKIIFSVDADAMSAANLDKQNYISIIPCDQIYVCDYFDGFCRRNCYLSIPKSSKMYPPSMFPTSIDGPTHAVLICASEGNRCCTARITCRLCTFSSGSCTV
jgi:hypothetical protein